MAASTVADPISNVLQRTFQNGSSTTTTSNYSSNKIHLNGSASSYDGRGLMRGGSSSSIGSVSHLDTSLQAASKKTQLTNNTIQFDPPIRYAGNFGSSLSNGHQSNGHQSNGHQSNGHQVNGLQKPKIIYLNPPKDAETNGDSSSKGPSSSAKSDGTSIPKPKIVYFPPNGIIVGYRQQRSAGAGMFNMGNTCYLNSTLQALFHTPALYNYLMNNTSHTASCNGGQGNGFIQNCMICAMTHTLRDTLRSNCIKPTKIYEKLKSICKHMVHGRQEDAHEFLRYLIEALQRSYLISERAPLKTLDNATKETTPFNQIFGGYMRQDVTCLRCKYVSTTFQHFMDLLLDIRQVSNIEDALQQHFKQERIGENPDSMYKCDKCKMKVPAKKRSLIERPPAVLCIQLKRFSLMGGKISKPVQLSRTLNMTPFINPGNGSGCEFQYKLVSMITHVGPSPNCGHYTAIGEAARDQFFQFDDSSVRPISIGQVMNTASYVVFYEMTKQSWDRRLSPSGATVTPNPNATSTVTSANATTQQQNGIKPLTPQISFKPKIISFSSPVVNRLGVVASTLKKTVTSVATSVAGSSIATANGSLKKTGLVPYDDDSDSESAPTAKAKNLEAVASVSQPKPVSRPTLVSPFVPRSVTVNVIKKEQEQQKPVLPPISTTPSAARSHPRPPSPSPSCESGETLKSSSGNWIVTDVDHHNPSVASDGSCGSTSGTWTVTPVTATPVKKHPNEMIRSTSPWTVMPNNLKPCNDSSEGKSSRKSENDMMLRGNESSCEATPTVIKLVREPFVPPILSMARKRGSVDDSDNDEYDAELDRGRTKKVRKAISAPSGSNQPDRSNSFNGQSERGNPFQFAQAQSYQKRNGGGDRSDSDGRRSWSGGHRDDRDRSRNFGDHERRKSFGGTDFRDSYHHHHYSRHGGGGGGGGSGGRHHHHDRFRSKPDFRRSFSNGRRNDYDGRKDFRSSNR